MEDCPHGGDGHERREDMDLKRLSEVAPIRTLAVFFLVVNVTIGLVAGHGIRHHARFVVVATVGATVAFAVVQLAAPGLLTEPNWSRDHRALGGIFSLMLAVAYLVAVVTSA